MVNCFPQGPCSFEPGLCGWKDTSLGAYKWDRNKGTTIVAGTGPSVDHTCGNASCKQPYILFLPCYEFYREESKDKGFNPLNQIWVLSVHYAAYVSDVTLSNSFKDSICFLVRSRLTWNDRGSTALSIRFSRIDYANTDVQKLPSSCDSQRVQSLQSVSYFVPVVMSFWF